LRRSIALFLFNPSTDAQDPRPLADDGISDRERLAVEVEDPGTSEFDELSVWLLCDAKGEIATVGASQDDAGAGVGAVSTDRALRPTGLADSLRRRRFRGEELFEESGHRVSVGEVSGVGHLILLSGRSARF
jgi:hypothetical protein